MTTTGTRAQPAPDQRLRRAALTIAAAQAAVAAGLFLIAAVVQPVAPLRAISVPWWMVAAPFAAAQLSLLHVEVRKQSRSISLTELPFVVGLLALNPLVFCATRAVAGMATELIVRRQYKQPVKLVFNTSIFVSEGLVGASVYRLVELGHPAHSAWPWVAALVATVAGNLVGALSVGTLIELVEGSRSAMTVLRTTAGGVLRSVCIANVGLVAALTLSTSDWAALPLAAVIAAFCLAYRAYAVVTERHTRLGRLYDFNRAITGHTDPDAIIATLLHEVTVMLHAESVRLARAATGEGVLADRWLDESGMLASSDVQWVLDSDGWVLNHVARDHGSLLLTRGTTDIAARDWLARNGLQEALLVPLAVDDGSASVLVVADRMGDVRGFDHDDQQLLETLVKQAAVELRNGMLMRRLRYESLHDSVTGIPNRSALQKAVERRLEICDTTVALGMVDLDAFKDVNDSFGHHSGDAMLAEIATRIVDAVGDRGDVCRFGGDEFAVALYGVTEAAAAGFFRELIEVLSTPIDLDGTAIEVGASIGISLAPEQAISWTDLVRNADTAMYAAKSAGRVAVVYDETLASAGRSRLGLVAALHRAIDNGELEVHVQPKALLSDGEVVSAEALVRWTHPEIGPLPPTEFIPLAERSGLIRDLTTLVLDGAVAACASWQRVAPGVGIAVNVSARCLQDDMLEGVVERSLRRHRLPAALLTLEITESSIMADPERTSGLLHRLRDRGVRMSIDDFGTGYSSLSYLRRLPVSEVKIDRSFVAGMHGSGDDAAIVQAIVELGHTLELDVVAEGVEDERTWAALQEAGCDLAQGYLLARPMPAADFGRWYVGRDNPVARPVTMAP